MNDMGVLSEAEKLIVFSDELHIVITQYAKNNTLKKTRQTKETKTRENASFANLWHLSLVAGGFLWWPDYICRVFYRYNELLKVGVKQPGLYFMVK